MDAFTPPPPNPPPRSEPPPPIPVAPETTPLPPPQPFADSTGLTPNIAAGICAAVPLVGGLVFLSIEKRDQFVRFWAMQSVFFGVGFAAVFIMIAVVGFICVGIPIIGWLFIPLLAVIAICLKIAALVLWIIMIVKAFSNVEWEIPVLGKLARRQLASSTPL